MGTHGVEQIRSEYRRCLPSRSEEAPYPPRRKIPGYSPRARSLKYRVMHVPTVRRRSNTRSGLLSMVATMMQIADPWRIRVPGETLRGEMPCCCFKILLLSDLGASSIP